MPVCRKCGRNIKEDKEICEACDSHIEVIKCNKCGCEAAAGSLACPVCGSNLANVLISVDGTDIISETKIDKTKKEAVKKRSTLKFIKKHIRAIAVAISVIAVIAALVIFLPKLGKKNGQIIIYKTEKNVCITDIDSGKSAEIENSEKLHGINYSALTNKLFYIDDGVLYERDFYLGSNKKQDEAKAIDENITGFVMAEDGNHIAYVKSTGDKTVDICMYNNGVKEIVDRNISPEYRALCPLYIKKDGSEIIYWKGYEVYRYKAGESNKEFNTNRIFYVSPELDEIIYEFDNQLFISKDGVISCLGDVQIYESYKDGSFYYYTNNTDNEYKTIYDYIDDDMLEDDLKITYPIKGETEASEYDSLLTEYEGKVRRDALREELKKKYYGEFIKQLYFYDGEKSSFLGDVMDLKAECTGRDYIITSKYRGELPEIKFSEIANLDALDAEDKVKNDIEKHKEVYFITRGGEYPFNSFNDGEYIIDDIADAYYIKEANELYFLSERESSNRKSGTRLLKRFVLSNTGTVIENDVIADDAILIGKGLSEVCYMTFNEDKKATQTIIGEVEILNPDHTLGAVDGNRIIYFKDGDLYLYDLKKNINNKLNSDVWYFLSEEMPRLYYRKPSQYFVG